MKYAIIPRDEKPILSRQFLKPETFSPLFHPLFDTGRFIANHQFEPAAGRSPVGRGIMQRKATPLSCFSRVYSRTRQIYLSTESRSSGYILVNAAKSHESATVSRKISRPPAPPEGEGGGGEKWLVRRIVATGF